MGRISKHILMYTVRNENLGAGAMGQYYKFVNTTRQEESNISLPFNFGLSWAKSLERLSEEELKEKFDYVIGNNNWGQDDEVIAVGDYGNIIYSPKK